MDWTTYLFFDALRHEASGQLAQNGTPIALWRESVIAVGTVESTGRAVESAIRSGYMRCDSGRMSLTRDGQKWFDQVDAQQSAATSGAIMGTESAETKYRFRLWRALDPILGNKRRMVWVMANPSTATATANDPTVATITGRARKEGFGVVDVVNLCPVRSTDPEQVPPLTPALSGVNERNLAYLRVAIERADMTAVGWGRVGETIGGGSWLNAARPMLATLRGVFCVARTASGAPRHPLRMRHDRPLAVFHARDS